MDSNWWKWKKKIKDDSDFYIIKIHLEKSYLEVENELDIDNFPIKDNGRMGISLKISSITINVEPEPTEIITTIFIIKQELIETIITTTIVKP